MIDIEARNLTGRENFRPGLPQRLSLTDLIDESLFVGSSLFLFNDKLSRDTTASFSISGSPLD